MFSLAKYAPNSSPHFPIFNHPIKSIKKHYNSYSINNNFKNINEISNLTRKRLLSGDTPTGPLHLGHWVGSLQKRVELQDQYNCFFIIANYHAMTTLYHKPEFIHESVLKISQDYISAGIDPEKSVIFAHSDVPAIHELMFIFSMLIPPNKLLQNPTLKNEIKTKTNNNNYSVGFMLYPIGQAADILAFRPNIVPVGEDQLPHIELTRFIAKRFNEMYGKNSQIGNKEFFPLPQALLGREKRLIGINPPDENGNFRKMSKSFNNAIYLSDPPEEITKKVRKIYTDPNRLTPSMPGKIENNPLWSFHDALNSDIEWVKQAKELYRQGKISDLECKEKLLQEILKLLAPMQERRRLFEEKPHLVKEILAEGAKKANAIANQTLFEIKELIHQNYK